MQAVLAIGVAGGLPHWTAAQTPPEGCKARWAAFEAAAKSRSLEAAATAERSLAAAPGCGRQRVSAKETVLDLYRVEADRLKRESAPPAKQLEC